MKKIMFNDQFGLTKAVLDGRKTQTRRAVPANIINEFGHNKFSDKSAELIQHSRYQVGEIVAIAQSYYDCGVCLFPKIKDENGNYEQGDAGDYNKMFVKADLMPHHIRITNIRVERLQDIIGGDCLREGIEKSKQGESYYFQENGKIKSAFGNPWPAFAALINKVSGKGTWQKNPYVFVYEFELVD